MNGKTHYVYDEQGQLIGEYDKDGNAIQETVYLGNLPVAVIKDGNVYYIHADHLNTPRAITDVANTAVWSWLSDPFGVTAANDDVDGDGTAFTYNLRFPGQYFDEETGLYYNYFRDYDPSTGRYVQSDPIGISRQFSDPLLQLSIGIGIPLMDSVYDAVINHTYGYARQNPVAHIDFYGLLEALCKKAGYQACNRLRKRCNAFMVPAMGFSTMGAYACGQFCDGECKQETDDFCEANPDENEPPPPTPPTLEDLEKYKP